MGLQLTYKLCAVQSMNFQLLFFVCLLITVISLFLIILLHKAYLVKSVLLIAVQLQKSVEFQEELLIKIRKHERRH